MISLQSFTEGMGIAFTAAPMERASIARTIRDSGGSLVSGLMVEVTNQGTNHTTNLHTEEAAG